MEKRLWRELQLDLQDYLSESLVVQFNDRGAGGHQSMVGGIQHDQAAWFIEWNEPSEISKELDRRKFDSATRNPNRLRGLKILGLTIGLIIPTLRLSQSKFSA